MFSSPISPQQFKANIVHDSDFGADFHSRMESAYAGLSERAKLLAATAYGFTAGTKENTELRKEAMDQMPLCDYDRDKLIELLDILGHVYQQEPNEEIRQHALETMGEIKAQRGLAHFARLLAETKLPAPE